MQTVYFVESEMEADEIAAVPVVPFTEESAADIIFPVAVSPSSKLTSSCLANLPKIPSEQIAYDPDNPVIVWFGLDCTPIRPHTGYAMVQNYKSEIESLKRAVRVQARQKHIHPQEGKTCHQKANQGPPSQHWSTQAFNQTQMQPGSIIKPNN